MVIWGTVAYSHESEHSSSEVAESIDIKMDGFQGYFSEKCMLMKKDKMVTFSYHSPNPVDFNLHFHTDARTDYPLKLQNTTNHTNTYIAPETREYCFTWKNPENNGESFLVKFSYKISL